jgi:hypothetical protein
MSPRRVVGTLAVLTVSLLGLAVVPAAQAVTGSPPVTVPDSVTLFTGSFAVVEPLANDTDPDGDELAVCRFDPQQVRGLYVEAEGTQIAIGTRPRAKPGVYTLTYYACDYSYLTAGTVTITVQKHPEISVRKLPGRPGHLRVTNPADFKIRFLWGDLEAQRPDGDVVVTRHSSTIITVRRESIIWVAFNRRVGVIDEGRLSGIDLRRTAPPVVDTHVPAGALKAWQS